MMKKWIVESFDKIKQYKLVFCFSVLSFIIAICCILVIGTDIFCISSLPLKDKSNILRNILLGLGALIAVPFLVWQNTTSHKALHETKENNQKTQSNNDKTQEAKMYIDCITQLANEKETIRTAAIHGLHELIKNTKDDSLKEKIFNILWSFMVEHSKKRIRINYEIKVYQKIKYPTEEQKKILEDLEKELKPEKENIEKFYSQFKIILQILAEHKDKTHKEWWQDKSVCDVWLYGINLVHAVLKNANLRGAKLRGAHLGSSNLQGSNLSGANLQGAGLEFSNLQGADLEFSNLQGANLQGAKLQGAKLQGAHLRYAKLQDANLECANLQDADLECADLQGADLQGARLQDAKLQFAKLQGAKLQGAKLQAANLLAANLEYITYDDKTNFRDAKYNTTSLTNPDTQQTCEPTQFPENFNPKARGMIDVSEEKS